MRTLLSTMAAAILVLPLAAEAPAQQPARPVRPLPSIAPNHAGLSYVYPLPHRGSYGYRAATVAESYARGLAARAYALGQLHRLAAEARLIHTYADTRDIENHDYRVRTYFAGRQANREARALERGPRLSPGDLVRLAAQAKPERLSPSELDHNGEIAWPVLLEADAFAASRAELERAFARRTASGRLQLDEHAHVARTAEAMLEVLETFVDEAAPMDYMAAKRFIESLAFDARQPLG